MRNLTPDNAFASESERSVFAYLERSLSDEWSGAHNIKLLCRSSSSTDRVCCEIDLVLIHPAYGIFLGEIKGGTHVSPSHSLRQAECCVPALERVLGACCAEWRFPPGTVQAFVCFPDKTRMEYLGKGFPLRTLYADDMAQGAESFFLKMLLGERTHHDYSAQCELLRDSASGLLVPTNVFRRTWRERFERFFLRIVWCFRDKNAKPKPSEQTVPPAAQKKKKRKKNVASAPILALLNRPETPQSIALLREMLAAGEDPNNCGNETASPLFKAIKGGKHKSAEILFRAGARVIPYSKKRVTKAFALFDDSLLAEMIVADTFGEPTEVLPTLFMLANGQNFVKTYEAMLRKYPREVLLDLPIDIAPQKKLSLVHMAAYLGKVEILQILAGNAFLLNEPDACGRTPLQIAEKYNREECILFLRSRARSIQSPDG